MSNLNPYSPPESEIESRAEPVIPWPWWMLVAAFLLTMANFAALILIPALLRDDRMLALVILCIVFPIVCGITVLILVDSNRFTLSGLGVFLSLSAISSFLDWGLYYLIWSLARGFGSI